MPLDRAQGEVLDPKLGPAYVVPARDYSDLERLQFPCEIDRADGKWPDVKSISIIDHAAFNAAKTFLAAGALFPIAFEERDLTVQWYPTTKTLVLIFQRKVNGAVMYVPLTYKPTDEHIRHLVFLGWPPPKQLPLDNSPPEAGELMN